jgi:hypothetical protein
MPGVTILPSQPPRLGLSFDRFQFDRRPRAVSAETHLTFQDAVHVEHRGVFRRIRWCPEFVNNKQQLRHVLAVATWRAAHGSKPIPAGLETNLPELKRLSEFSIKKWERDTSGLTQTEQWIVRRHKFNVQRAGGLLQLFASVVYLSFMLGQTSPDVAGHLCITPPNVRTIRYRLCEIARRLGYSTFERHSTVGLEKGIAKRRRLWREAAKRYRARKRKCSERG